MRLRDFCSMKNSITGTAESTTGWITDKTDDGIGGKLSISEKNSLSRFFVIYLTVPAKTSILNATIQRSEKKGN